MRCFKIIFICLMVSYSSILFSQIEGQESIYETKYDKIATNDLEINYKGQSFTFGDSFESVDHKIGKEAEYSGEFNLKLEGVGFFNGTADYMIRFRDADFYFENGRFSYFEIRNKDFSVKLRAHDGNNGVVNLRVGQSVNVMKKLFKKSFAEKITKGDADHDRFTINIGDLEADSPIANNFLIMVHKGTDKIWNMAFYGY